MLKFIPHPWHRLTEAIFGRCSEYSERYAGKLLNIIVYEEANEGRGQRAYSSGDEGNLLFPALQMLLLQCLIGYQYD
jgi:hypothetical protein